MSLLNAEHIVSDLLPWHAISFEEFGRFTILLTIDFTLLQEDLSSLLNSKILVLHIRFRWHSFQMNVGLEIFDKRCRFQLCRKSSLFIHHYFFQRQKQQNSLHSPSSLMRTVILFAKIRQIEYILLWSFWFICILISSLFSCSHLVRYNLIGRLVERKTPSTATAQHHLMMKMSDAATLAVMSYPYLDICGIFIVINVGGWMNVRKRETTQE